MPEQDRAGRGWPHLAPPRRRLAGKDHVVLLENRGAQVSPLIHNMLRSFFVAPMNPAAINPAPMNSAAEDCAHLTHGTARQIARTTDGQWAFRQAIRLGDAAERTLGNDCRLPWLRRLLIDHTPIGMILYNPRKTSFAETQRPVAVQHAQALVEARDADRAVARIEAFAPPTA